jgi:periplasmic protein TonB
MKHFLPILLLMMLSQFARAQKIDTTIYSGCQIINDTTKYVGSNKKQYWQQLMSSKRYPDCNYFRWPRYPGGDKAFSKFLSRNLKWKNDLDARGIVLISFIVEKNGSLTHITVLHGLTPALNAEALRVIRLSPRWIPAKGNGRPIRNYFIVPIRFYLEN